MCEFRVCCFCSESLSTERTQAAMSFKIRGRWKTHVPACSLLLPCMHYFGSKLQASRHPLRAMAGLLKTLSLGACTLGGFRLPGLPPPRGVHTRSLQTIQVFHDREAFKTVLPRNARSDSSLLEPSNLEIPRMNWTKRAFLITRFQ